MHKDRFRIRRETTPEGITVLTPAPEIDFTTAPELEKALTTTGRLPCTVIDFSQVLFLDSSGINALVNGQRVAEAAGGWIRLAGLQDHIARTIHMVGLHTIFPIYSDRQAALQR